MQKKIKTAGTGATKVVAPVVAATNVAANEKLNEKAVKKSKKFTAKDNENDRKVFDKFRNFLPKIEGGGEFDFNYIANGGVTVKLKKDGRTRGFFSFDSPRRTDKGVVGNIYLTSIKNNSKLKELFGEEIKIVKSSTNVLEVKGVSVAEVCDALKNKSLEFNEIINKLI